MVVAGVAPVVGSDRQDVANLTARKHNADETLKRHCEELTKAQGPAAREDVRAGSGRKT